MQPRNKNDVLLTELVIVILVFSLVAVTVVQMFVAARQKSVHSAQLERALVVATDWVERLSGASDPAELLSSSGFTFADQNSYVLDHVEARVQPEVRTEAGRTLSATVYVFGEDPEQAPLVALPMLQYIPYEEVGP